MIVIVIIIVIIIIITIVIMIKWPAAHQSTALQAESTGS